MSGPKGDFGKNRVAFVTLNYDRSLERYLFLRLKAQHQYDNDEECFRELYQLRFVHMYGSLGDERFVDDPFNRNKPSIAEVQRAADRLRIIHEETTEAQYLSEAVKLLKEAQVICFLGYGFHGLNNDRLTLATIPQRGQERIDRQDWFASRYQMTEVEFSRHTRSFYDKFVNRGYTHERIGNQQEGALEFLRRLPVI